MGYKPGQGIGPAGGGRVAPLEVDLKASRAGLGIDEAKKRQRDTTRAQQAERGVRARAVGPAVSILPASGSCVLRRLKPDIPQRARLCCGAGAKQARLHEEAQAAFLQVKAASFSTRQAESHVAAARKVRAHLAFAKRDGATCIVVSSLTTGYRRHVDHQTTGVLQQVIEALDEKAGLARHELWPPQPPPPALADGEEDGATDSADVEPPPWEALPAEQRLLDVLRYLRQRHHFCLFCKCQVRQPVTRGWSGPQNQSLRADDYGGCACSTEMRPTWRTAVPECMMRITDREDHPLWRVRTNSTGTNYL